MKKFVLSALLVLVSAFGAVNAQTNDVRLSAGATNINSVTTFTGSAEVRKTVAGNFQVSDALSLTTDGDTNLVENKGVVRGYFGTESARVFAGGGLNVGKLTNRDAFLNPVLQAGINFDIAKINIEPYVELQTPDLLSNSRARSLAVALTGKVNLSDSFGILATGGVRSTRLDNDFFTGRNERFLTGGLFFNF